MTETQLADVLGERPFRFYPSVESTNSAALAWVKGDVPAPSGSVVVADEQTAGRGRFKRRWLTPRGAAVAMSIILHCEAGHRLAPAAGLAVADTVSPLVEADVGLKWPNDVEIDGKKLAGILIESVLTDARPTYIVGIGINVDELLGEDGASLSTALGREVTSLSEYYRAGSGRISREHIIAETARRLEELMDEPRLMEWWKERLTTIGTRVEVNVFGKTVAGTAVDVDADGALVVRDEEGRTHHLSAGDVSVTATGFDNQM